MIMLIIAVASPVALMTQGIFDAMSRMTLKYTEAHLLNGRLYCGYLGKDVDTVTIGLHHFL